MPQGREASQTVTATLNGAWRIWPANDVKKAPAANDDDSDANGNDSDNTLSIKTIEHRAASTHEAESLRLFLDSK